MKERTAPPKDGASTLSWVNFAVIAIGGLAVLAWMERFTDWLGTAMVVVGLGGLLAWPRSLVGWLPGFGPRLGEAAGRALSSKVTLIVALAALVAAGGVSLFVGSVAVRSLEPDGSRRLVFRPAERLPTARLFAGDSEVRRPFWTGWSEPARIDVEVAGYPPTQVEVRPWRRVRLIVPDDFRRPTVLLRPTRKLALALGGALRDPDADSELVVQLPDEEEPRRMAYAGRAVWIGCTADCEIPEKYAEEWADAPATIAWRWFSPQQLAGPLPRLRAGDRVEASITMDGVEVAQAGFRVRGSMEAQVEDIDAKETDAQ